MKRFIGLLCVCILALASVGPVRAATLVAQAAPQQAAHNTGAVSGTVHDNTGAPVADARITLKGPGTYHTTSDAAGHFEIAGVEAGFYSFTASKAGYNTAAEPQMAVFTGETKQLVVRMNHVTLTSLRTIASVRAVGRGTFNTSTAAVQVVSSQVFTNQGQLQVTRVLNQIPDVQISFPGGSANGAVAGAITVPTIRGANSFETQSMIDGHPLAVGRYGDYVTTFLNPYMLRSVQVVKGPGALVPQINGAIGGTINFRTKDPTLKPEGNLVFGVDNHGGSFSNFSASDTTLHGRLGFVFDLSSIDT
ncbi:MAG: carboxypeptidase-like regulatory domain-containing protein, partial [Vulcanimicrobiaceae bacterium]